jgi:hypothetical protein
MSPRPRAAAKRAPALTFRGPPQRLTTLVPLPAGADVGEPRALLEGVEVRGVSLRPPRDGAAHGRVLLRLSKMTPPGRYAGSVELGGGPVPVVVEVEPQPRVEASPSRLRVDVEPGGEVTVGITLANVGNVPFDVPAVTRSCVFDQGGVDHAFWVALASEEAETRSRIDLLLDDLAGSHGGLVEMRARPSEAIAPGGVQDVELTLRFSDRLQPGGVYSGAWDAEGLHVRLRVDVPKTKRAARKAEKEAR